MCIWNICRVTGISVCLQLSKGYIMFLRFCIFCLYISIPIIVVIIIILSGKQRRVYLEAEIKPLADSLKWNLLTTSLQKCVLSYAIFIIWIDTSYENNLIVCSAQPLFNEFLTIWEQAVGGPLLNFIFALQFSSPLLHLFRIMMTLTFVFLHK